MPLNALIIDFVSGSWSKSPKLGLNLSLNIYKAVDLPVPFSPTRPKILP